MANWGPCPGAGALCCADLAPFDDGNVGPGDLAQLLSQWGECPLDCGEGLLGGPPSGGTALEDAVIALGFENLDAFNEWALTADPEEVSAYADLIYEMISD